MTKRDETRWLDLGVKNTAPEDMPGLTTDDAIERGREIEQNGR